MSCPYSRWDWFWAVNLCAFLGWVFVVTPMTFLGGGVTFLVFGAIFGLPIALIACWVIAAPILWWVMRRPVTWTRAARWGAILSAVMMAIYISWDRYMGWLQSTDDSYYSQRGGGDYVQSVDGILTPYGWWVLAQGATVFILGGGVVALLIRWAIGPGSVVEAERTVNQ